MYDLIPRENDSLPDYELSRILGYTSSPDFDFHSLINAIDCQRDLYGVGIIYNDGNHSYLVRPSQRRQQRVTHLIITKVIKLSQPEIAKSVKETVKEPSIGKEIASTALSCGALLLTSITSAACVGAVPITGGASGVMVAVMYAGTIATAAQCGIGLVRLYDIATNDGRGIDWVDKQSWYKATATALDMISLASLAGPLKEAVMTYRVMKSASTMKVIEWLKRYPRMERVRLTMAIIKHLNPGISNTAIKVLLKKGIYPRRFPTDGFHKLLATQITNVVTSGMAISGSMISGVIHSSGEYAFSVAESLEIIN